MCGRDARVGAKRPAPRADASLLTMRRNNDHRPHSVEHVIRDQGRNIHSVVLAKLEMSTSPPVVVERFLVLCQESDRHKPDLTMQNDVLCLLIKVTKDESLLQTTYLTGG